MSRRLPFEPIAIVGRSCMLPGAASPGELWEHVAAGRSLLGPAPAHRWRLRKELAVGEGVDRTWTDIGGYVTGFDKLFDPTGFALPADEILALDPVFQWVMHCGREALRSAGIAGTPRTGLVMGNLCYPSASMTRFAESVWLEAQGPQLAQLIGLERPHPQNRFMSGGPAQLAARALGLGAGAFALDAACASSLYAIKFACDALHDGTADTMLAGAVSCADDLFIHIGFAALQALSRTGQSRPFHRDTDGLVPAEGAAFVTLRRLSDAAAAGQPILGVIKGIGLSNDGRGRGFLAPSEEGQVRAMRQAWDVAGLAPEVGLIECHATGTAVGDATEIRSMKEIFNGSEVPIGSLKGNLGHLITSAGAAGLLKVLSAFEHGQLPPTLHTEAPIKELAGSPFRPVRALAPWRGSRRAAVSAFGFGGNNAHLIVEQWDGSRPARSSPRPVPPAIAIVGIGARVADGESQADFVRALVAGEPRTGQRKNVTVEAEGLRFPPRDLEQTLPQQLMILEAAREAARSVKLVRDETAVFVGMTCDPEIARYGARWRSAEWAEALSSDAAWVASARSAFERPLESAGVIGRMPNITANRINSQLDLAGMGLAICAEELSGTIAIHLARRALEAGEIGAALVGAVDLSHEPVHLAALRALGVDQPPGDAAVVLTLKRLDDAKADGDTVFALLGDDAPAFDTSTLFGRAHAAKALVDTAAAVAAETYGLRLRAGAPAMPSLRPGARPWWSGERLALHVYSGENKRDVLRALAEGRESDGGPARLALVAADADLSAKHDLARRWMQAGGPAPEGIAFRERPVGGEIGFVFTGAAAGYEGMGRDLVLAFPSLVAQLREQSTELADATSWVYGGAPRRPLEQLWGTSFLCQLHAVLTRDLLGIRADASIGYSSGETNALFAMGAWNDPDQMVRESREGPLFRQELVGEFAALKRVWARLGAGDGRWAAFAVSAEIGRVQAALQGEPLAHLTIVNSADECVIGGESRAVQRVLQRLGTDRVWPLEYELAAHCPEVEEVREAWRTLHRRQTTSVPGVRFYSNALARSYVPTADSAADALTGQAIHLLDFPRTIEQAWNDGVRVFVEHGPRGSCSGWIRRILGDREHVAVPLDLAGRSAVRQVAHAIATLVAAGVEFKSDEFFAQLEGASEVPRAGTRLTFPAHAAPVRLPPTGPACETMEPAPVLPSMLEDLLAAGAAAGGSREVIEGVVAFQAQVATAHRQFIEQQAAMHSQFVALQQASIGRFLERVGAVSSGVPSPTLPLSASAKGPADSVPGRGPERARAKTSFPSGTSGFASFSDRSATPKGAVALALSGPLPGTESAGPLADAERGRVGEGTPEFTAHPGPKFSRADLETLATGKISSLFGPAFAPQDSYRRQVRMPEPPLLLADRVTGIDAEPASMKTGTIWTETDIRLDGWYLGPDGRMPPGLMIESGQADLLLISWLGVDLLNRGERVYRLLGCELTYHGSPPRPGETLAYDIHVDGHAQQGDVRLFFFHYDCRVNGELRLSVRHGQAGFFTDEELANSGGVLWSPDEEKLAADLRRDAPTRLTKRRSLTHDQLVAFSEGRAADCFGEGFETTRTHVRSPRIAPGRMLLPQSVDVFDPDGGPWKRGYLRAQQPLSPDDWFLKGHFKNDPCMPGTLMFDGCLQAMAIYLAALGYTIDRDGWRFEPVTDTPYPMRCRGQATPSSRLLMYEIFVREIQAGPVPTLYADILCTVDGLKAFHAKRIGLRLVPDWPLEHWSLLGPHLEQETGVAAPSSSLAGLVRDEEPVLAASIDGFQYDYKALLSCAWGRPSDAFGPTFKRFDSPRRVARLPGPPYHFISRVTKINARPGAMEAGGEIEVEYDVPERAWYFAENGAPTMPFCVLLEAALQPCGWFANFVGSPLQSETDMLFRNLDGTGTMRREIRPGTGPLRSRVKLTKISPTPTMIIVSFEVSCFVGDELVYDLNTVFGFFPKEAFENQVGLPVSPEERTRISAPSNEGIDLRARPARFCNGTARLAGPMLLMLDRVTAFDRTGGRAGLGWLRAEKDVDPAEWMFKAHFFQDPVQPGSLGLEALCQLLQFYMLDRGIGAGIANPRFEPLMLGRAMTWKYRGQVIPTNKRVTTELEVTEIGEDFAVADAWLWVDGRRIYHAKNLGMRIVAS